MEENEWVPQIQEQYLLGINHVLDYIQTEAYRMLVFYRQHKIHFVMLCPFKLIFKF